MKKKYLRHRSLSAYFSSSQPSYSSAGSGHGTGPTYSLGNLSNSVNLQIVARHHKVAVKAKLSPN